MKKKLAELLCQCNEDFKLYEGYSGRGMFGAKTTGVVCDSSIDLVDAILANADLFIDEEGYPLFQHCSLRTDTLAGDIIVY